MALVNQVRNPSFEYGVTAGVATTGYNLSGTAATVTQQVDGAAPSGTHVAKVVVTGGNQGFADLLAGTYASTDKISVFVAMKGSAGGEVVTLLLSDSGGTTFASVGSPATLTTTWTGYYLDVSASSNNWQGGAFSGKTIGLVVRSGPSSGAATFFVDAAMANINVALGSYFDGDNGGTWNGTPGDSASTETAAGAALAGTAAITTTATGTLVVALAGSAAIATTAAGSIGGVVMGSQLGKAQPAAAQLAALAGSPPAGTLLAGTSAIVTTATGTMVVAVSGIAAIATTATGTLVAPLAGTAAIVTAATGTLAISVALSGAMAIAVSASGALTGNSSSSSMTLLMLGRQLVLKDIQLREPSVFCLWPLNDPANAVSCKELVNGISLSPVGANSLGFPGGVAGDNSTMAMSSLSNEFQAPSTQITPSSVTPNTFTIEAMICSEPNGNQYNVIGQNSAWALEVVGNNIKFSMFVSGAIATSLLTSSNPLNGGMQLVQVTYDATTLRLYVDGLLVASVVTTGTIYTGNGAVIRVCGRGLTAGAASTHQSRAQFLAMYRSALGPARCAKHSTYARQINSDRLHVSTFATISAP